MRVYEQIFAQHTELLMKRSAQAWELIANSLKEEGARPVVVGCYQMRNHCGGMEGKRGNLLRMLAAIRQAATAGVQVLAFPEMCLPGYFTHVSGTAAEAREANRQLADQVGNSPFLAQLQDAAREAAMVIAFGFSEQAGDLLYNSIGVVDADGTWLGVRRKNPLYPWPYETESFAEPDATLRSAVFRTRYATVGISNCFDGEFPESVRRMRLEGAELLLWCNAACGDSTHGTSHRINHSASYAQANRLWVVCCNCVAVNASGTSLIVGPSGEPLVILPPDEEALGITTINLAMSAEWDIWRTRLGPEWADYR